MRAIVKAYTYLGSAQLKLGRPAEALAALRRAYQLAIAQRSPSVAQIAASCLDAKKARWEQAETARIRSESALLAGTQDLIMRDARRRADAAVATAAAAAAAAAGGRAPHGASTGSAGDDGSNLEDDIMEAARSQCRALENVFGQADAARLRRRDVPDWLVDNITFGIMWDPVVVRPRPLPSYSYPPPISFGPSPLLSLPTPSHPVLPLRGLAGAMRTDGPRQSTDTRTTARR